MLMKSSFLKSLSFEIMGLRFVQTRGYADFVTKGRGEQTTARGRHVARELLQKDEPCALVKFCEL